MRDAPRVFVTGLGVVSSIGNDVESFWDACKNGQSRTEKVPEHWAHYYSARSEVWSPLPDPDFSSAELTRTDLLTIGRPAAIAVVAAKQALEQAELRLSWHPDRYPMARIAEVRPERFGVYIGTGLGAAQAPFNNYYAHLLGGLRPHLDAALADSSHEPLIAELRAGLREHPRVNPLVICQTMPNAIAANLSIRLGATGPSDTICAACASGTIAIGKAFQALHQGSVDIAITGGVEHLSDRAGGVFMGFDRLQTLAKPFQGIGSENRPFDRDRSGFLFSEGGAAIAVLETEESMLRRGTRPIAEILGFAETTDANSMAAIKEGANSIEAMIDMALAHAGIQANDIDYLNAHGTGTEVNDEVEAAILELKFPKSAKINSTKSILGHTIGAAGAFEFAVTALSLQRQEVHVSKNLTNPVRDLNFCTASGHASLRHGFSQSFGFGGHNAGLVLRAWQN